MQFRVFLQLYWPQYVRTFCRYHFIEKSKYSIQLGLEKDNSTNLVEAFFDQEELRRIFLEFYTYGVVANKEAYKPLA